MIVHVGTKHHAVNGLKRYFILTHRKGVSIFSFTVKAITMHARSGVIKERMTGQSTLLSRVHNTQ